MNKQEIMQLLRTLHIFEGYLLNTKDSSKQIDDELDKAVLILYSALEEVAE